MSPAVSDFLSQLPSTSSGRSSISLNSLLSDYLLEMQQLAEGTLLQQGLMEDEPSDAKASDHHAPAQPTLDQSGRALRCQAGVVQHLLSWHTALLVAQLCISYLLQHLPCRSQQVWAQHWKPQSSPTSSCSPWSCSPSAPATPGRSLGCPLSPACRRCPSAMQVLVMSCMLRMPDLLTPVT